MSVVVGVGSPGSAQTASGGKVYPFSTIGNVTPVQILAINGNRNKFVVHNPGTNDVLVYPQLQASGAANAPTVAAPGGAFRVFSNGGSLTIDGECQGAWSALSVAGTGQPLTVMESNV